MSERIRNRAGAILVLAFVLIAGLQTSLYPRNAPPYLDGDTATMVIFVNNVAEQRSDPAGFFRHSEMFQDTYRADWAYQFLPVSLPIAALKTVLGIEARHTAALVIVLAVLLGGLSCTLAAAFMRVAGEADRHVVAFTFAGTWLVPTFALFGRTGVVSFMLYACLFWGAMLLFALYCRSGRVRYLYGISLVLGFHLLCGYPTLYQLPIFFLATWLLQPKPLALARTRHVPIAICLIPVVAAALIGLYCLLAQVPLHDYWTHAMRFYGARAGSSVAGPTIIERAATFFRKQVLLDQVPPVMQSRGEDLWLYGQIVWSWLLLLGLACWGAIQALRSAEQPRRIVALALVASLVVCTLFFTPELRYMLTLTPCYIYLAARALDRLGRWRPWALLALLLALAAESSYVASHAYSDNMKQRWSYYAGEHEAINLILQSTPADSDAPILFDTFQVHQMKYQELLYILAYSDSRFIVPTHTPMMNAYARSGLPPARIFLLTDDARPAEAAEVQARGFQHYADITDTPTGRTLTLWLRDTRPPAAPKGD